MTAALEGAGTVLIEAYLKWAALMTKDDKTQPIGQWDPFGEGSTRPLKASHSDVDPVMEVLKRQDRLEKDTKERFERIEKRLEEVAAGNFKRTPAGSNINKVFRG